MHAKLVAFFVQMKKHMKLETQILNSMHECKDIYNLRHECIRHNCNSIILPTVDC